MSSLSWSDSLAGLLAAWTVGDRRLPAYEVGLANLTKDATTMLVHYSPDRSQQFSLVRIEAPAEDKK